MIRASIDIGSNTLRLLVADVSGGMLKPLHYGLESTRLARGLTASGMLDANAKDASLRVLDEFIKKAQSMGAVDIYAFGTSALREARDSGQFLDRVTRSLGLEVHVISGEHEARMTALGVLSSIDTPLGAIVIDIGGGSMEVIASSPVAEVLHAESFPVGVVKLIERHGLSALPTSGELVNLEHECREVGKAVAQRFGGHVAGGMRFVATAGTATTLAAIDLALTEYDASVVHGHKLSMPALCQMRCMLIEMPLLRRMHVPGLPASRADLIIPGIILTMDVMESLGFDEMLVSDQGILEGALLWRGQQEVRH